MNYIYNWTHNNTAYTFNINFIEQEELITDAHEADPYKLRVTCTNMEADQKDPNTMLTRRVRGSAEFALIALNNDPGQSRPVYGTYWRENTPGDYFAREVIGISTSQDAGAGYSSPAENFDLSGSTFNYTSNNFSFIIDGIAHTGHFNETQAFQTFWVFIEQMLFESGVYNCINGTVEMDLEIEINLPAFDNFAHFQAYIADGATEGLLNGDIEPVPEPEEYYGKYYVNNLVSNSPGIGQIRYEYYYRFDGPTNCLGFYSEDGKTAKLKSYHGGPSAIYASDDRGVTYEQTGSYPFTFYTESDVDIPLYVLTFKTNIPFFEGDSTDSGKDKLDSFMNGTPAPSGREYTADDAVNRSLLDADIFGKIGDVVNQTTNGTSTIAWTYGVQMFDLTETQKNNFLRNILSQARVNDLLDNTKLFGSNQIGALQSLRFFPIDVSEVCSEGSAPSCQIGSYTYNFSSSVNQILQNNKMINMGEQFFRSPYEDGDFRNFEPWCKLYVLLPYAGIHELVISRYINTRVGIKLAVDVTTGACEYHIFSNGKEMDSFQGQMGSQIPLTANDKASQVSAVQNGILTSVSGLAQSASDVQQTIGAAGSMITGGMDTGKALTSGGPFTPGINALNSGVTIAQGAQTAIRNFLNAPIQTKGASAGNLGDFGVNSPYFIFAWANSIVPKNEINLVGKPSNQGGKVGEFAGYLKCSAFRLANGFTGTAAEAAQIAAQMMEGVYI